MAGVLLKLGMLLKTFEKDEICDKLFPKCLLDCFYIWCTDCLYSLVFTTEMPMQRKILLGFLLPGKWLCFPGLEWNSKSYKSWKSLGLFEHWFCISKYMMLPSSTLIAALVWFLDCVVKSLIYMIVWLIMEKTRNFVCIKGAGTCLANLCNTRSGERW